MNKNLCTIAFIAAFVTTNGHCFQDQDDENDLAMTYGSEEFVSIATGRVQLVSKAPAVATVITAEDIKAIGATDIDEALETVPGLHVSYNEFYNPIYTLRGIHSKFNPQMLLLINGISISNLYLGNRGLVWAGMPVESIERIEIIRGPGSAVYGADAFAGTINIITKNKKYIQKNMLGLSTGSHSTQSVWLTYGKNFGETEFAFMAEYYSTDGHEEQVTADLQSVLDMVDGTNASLAPDSVSLSRDVLDIRLDINKGNWRLRSGFQQRANVGTGAGVAEALDAQGRFKSDRKNLDLTYNNSELSDDWDIKAQVSYFHTTQEVEENIILFPPGSELGLNAVPFPNGVIGNPEVIEDHWRANFSAFYNGIENHNIRIGAGFHDATISEVRESKNFGLDTSGSPIIPGDPIVSVNDSPYIFLPEDDRDNSYFFLQDIWKFSNDWELTSGIRYDDYSDFGNTVNPRAALVWSTNHNLTTKFLYGSAFRAPSFAETRNQNNPVALGNPNLSPEEINTYEVAFDYKPNYDMRLGLNIFSYSWDDIIDFIPDPAPATTTTAQNFGKQTGKGVEIEFDWEVSDTFKFISNFAYQSSTNKNTNTDAHNTPKTQAYIRSDWKFSKSWKAVTQIHMIRDRGRAFGDTRSEIDDYNIVNLGVHYSNDNSPWIFSLNIKNVFDEEAYEPSSPVIPNDLPLSKQTAHANIEYEF